MQCHSVCNYEGDYQKGIYKFFILKSIFKTLPDLKGWSLFEKSWWPIYDVYQGCGHCNVGKFLWSNEDSTTKKRDLETKWSCYTIYRFENDFMLTSVRGFMVSVCVVKVFWIYRTRISYQIFKISIQIS